MRRYQSRRDIMSREMGFDPAPSFKPPQMPSQLDAKDERLLELSAEVGRLEGQNDLLAEDNGRLEDENRKLQDDNKSLRESNREYERREDQASAGYKSGQQLVDEIEKALKNKKEK